MKFLSWYVAVVVHDIPCFDVREDETCTSSVPQREDFFLVLILLNFLKSCLNLNFLLGIEISFLSIYRFIKPSWSSWSLNFFLFSPLKCFSRLLFLLFSFSLSSLFCIRPIYVKFHVIYQVKGISRYVWGVCKCEWVCFGMRRCVGVGLGMCGSVQVCAYTHGCAQVWVWWWVWIPSGD